MFSLVGFSASRRRRVAAACVAAVVALAAPAASLATSSDAGQGGFGSGRAIAAYDASPTRLRLDRRDSNGPSGGGGVSSSSQPKSPTKAPPGSSGQGHWLTRFTITEYWPSPESWFVGKLVKAPGLPGRHRIDWLYSALGVSMEGDGVALDGRRYHIEAFGNAGWVTAAGKPTSASNGFEAGAPFWRGGGYWRNAHGGVTFPLSAGGWSAGTGKRYVPLRGVRFAAGPSLPLHYLQSIAVDPKVIPLGSRVYIPAYRHDGHGGWFVAQDTGGAINGHRIDVYRRPPASPNASGADLTSQRVFVIKPR